MAWEQSLEAFAFRRGSNHNVLARKTIQLVFHHRKTSLKKLPIVFGKDFLEILEKNWNTYRRKIKVKQNFLKLPESIENVISVLNQWLEENDLC